MGESPARGAIRSSILAGRLIVLYGISAVSGPPPGGAKRTSNASFAGSAMENLIKTRVLARQPFRNAAFGRANPLKQRVLRCFLVPDRGKPRVLRCLLVPDHGKPRVLRCFSDPGRGKLRVLRCFRYKTALERRVWEGHLRKARYVRQFWPAV